MNVQLIKIIETGIVIVMLIITHYLTRRVIKNFLKKFKFTNQRRKLTIRMLNLLLSITAVVFIAAIWGVKQTDIVVFISSVLAVLGIGFFAQWSLLSNITAGLILFFNHPLKIGDHIKIIEKDFIIEGKIVDITYFFLHIKTKKNERVTISNTLIIQKIFSVQHSETEELKKTQ